MATVSVSGSARTRVRPDQATLDLGVSHVAATSSAALDHVAEQTRRLAEQLTALGFEDREWSTHGVTLGEEWEWKNDTNTRVGFRATSGVTITIDDLELVSALLRAAVDEAGAQIRSLQWSVAADNPARISLLGEAALDAQRRAAACVAALGLELGAVEDISDAPTVTPPSPRAGGEAMMLRSAKVTDGDTGLAVNPGEVELTATIYVRFGTMAHR